MNIEYRFFLFCSNQKSLIESNYFQNTDKNPTILKGWPFSQIQEIFNSEYKLLLAVGKWSMGICSNVQL